MKLTIGADPEFFLFDSKKEMHVSAHDFVPGTKEEPHKLKHGAVQLDGTAVEFNINPASTAEEFAHNIRVTIDEIREMIPRRFNFDFKPSVRYNQSYWGIVPESQKELGCTPDFNANWERMQPNVRPKPPRGYENMRTGAGHIHIGWTDKADPYDVVHYWDCRQIVKAMNVVYEQYKHVFDTDTERQYLYGSGAAFRPKPYGVEYRTPSNAWLKYPKVWNWLFELPHNIVGHLEKNSKAYQNIYYYSYYTNDGRLAALNKLANTYKINTLPTDWDKEVARW